MRVVEYDELAIHLGELSAADELKSRALSGLISRYPSQGVLPEEKKRRETSITNSLDQLEIVLLAAGGSLEGKVFLDLGAGTTAEVEEAYNPWLCRALQLLGAKAIAVDVMPLDGEPYEHYCANLLLPGALAQVKDASVDVAHAHALLSSPRLEELAARLGSLNCFESLLGALAPQLRRVLKPEGIFVYND